MIYFTETDDTGRINATTSHKEYAADSYFEFDFPEDFDFSNQREYRIVKGELIRDVAPPSKSEIESQMAFTKEQQMRKAIELFVRTANLTDDQALELSLLHDEWKDDKPYTRGDTCRYEGFVWRCIEDHVAQPSWNPVAAPSLWAKILPGQSGDIGVWQQPGPTNPYQYGDKVTHEGKTWISDIDGNVWEPGVYGWSETGDTPAPPADDFPEYVAGKEYFYGNQITYVSEHYVCVYPKGMPCVWSPDEYPAGWKKLSS